jgi:hypothetical protein
MTRQDAINWLNAQNGKSLDYELLVLWLNSVIASKTMTSAVVLFANRATDNTGVIVSSPSAVPSVVNARVFFPANYHKVLYSIIQLVVVNMMDYLITPKVSANRLLHNVSMLFDFIVSGVWVRRHIKNSVTTLNSDPTFPSRVLNSLHTFFLARIRAKNQLPLFMGFKKLKCLFAIIAFKKGFSAFVITTSIAISSFLARRSFEFCRALFANINHTISIQTSMLLVNKGV